MMLQMSLHWLAAVLLDVVGYKEVVPGGKPVPAVVLGHSSK